MYEMTFTEGSSKFTALCERDDEGFISETLEIFEETDHGSVKVNPGRFEQLVYEHESSIYMGLHNAYEYERDTVGHHYA